MSLFTWLNLNKSNLNRITKTPKYFAMAWFIMLIFKVGEKKLFKSPSDTGIYLRFVLLVGFISIALAEMNCKFESESNLDAFGTMLIFTVLYLSAGHLIEKFFS